MATGNVPITAGSGTLIRVNSNSSVDSGAYQQLMGLAGPDGTLAPHDPDGTLQVSPEATTLLLDDFSSNLSNWTLGGTSPTISGGVLTTSTATTASATSYMRTSGQMTLRAASYLRTAFLVKLEVSPVTNNSRWWGYGQNQSTPSAAAPVLNGAVFIVDFTDGSMKAATYSAGTRNNVISLTRPTDNAYHRYEIYYRQSVIYWLIDGVTVATVTMPNLAVANNMYGIIGSANNTTSPSSGPSLSVSAFSIADQSGTNRTISDGATPWIQASVKAGNSPSAASDQALVVGIHPTSPLPAGTSKVGSVDIGASPSATVVTTTASTNATAVKTSAGNLQSVVISNPTATAVYVKLYNKASAPTVGTDVPVITRRVAATGSVDDTVVIAPGVNGARFTTGIALATTAAAAAADTAVAVAGVQILITYI